MKKFSEILSESTHPHSVHVRDYSNGSDIDGNSPSWGSDHFKNAMAKHEAEHDYATDKGHSFKFKHRHQATGFTADVNKHHKDLVADIDR